MENPLPPPARLLARFAALLQRSEQAVLFFVPESCRLDPDRARRARLITHFGLQGLLFGAVYALFYAAIGHRLGALTIVACSVVFGAIPWWLKWFGNLEAAGHILVATMALGFYQLTLIEGGVHSHAIAWMASVPLCALLILGVRPASLWAAISLASGLSIGIMEFCGVKFVPTYDPRWSNLIDGAGNLGLVAFLFVLGLVFEISRSQAFGRMTDSLDELVTSNSELAHLNNEKTEFLGIAAHDLRNPLSAVIGFAEILERDPVARTAKMAATISKAGRRMLDLVNDLLDANAIESGQYASNLEPEDLRELALASVGNNALAAERKQIALDFNEGPALLVMANRQATLQVMDNLISNAVKYSPLGSRVTLSVQTVGENVEFAVQDQGPGLSAEDQKKLFQRHTKLTARPTAGESSVGLGLSIVKRLAKAMNGTVFCRSELGAGCLFVFQLVRIENVDVPPKNITKMTPEPVVRPAAEQPVLASRSA